MQMVNLLLTKSNITAKGSSVQTVSIQLKVVPSAAHGWCCPDEVPPVSLLIPLDQLQFDCYLMLHSKVYHCNIEQQCLDAVRPKDYTKQYANGCVQVSWCKLEVEVSTPKSITTSAEGQNQEVPPLVVAALNLKTRFNAQVAVLQYLITKSYVLPLLSACLASAAVTSQTAALSADDIEPMSQP